MQKKIMKLVLICVAIIYFLNSSDGARILGIFPLTTYSHFILGHTLMKELASRGHEVTVMSPYPQKTPIENYKDIDLSEMLRKHEENRKNVFDIINVPPAVSILFLHHWIINGTSECLKMDVVQDFLKSDQKFDLVIVEEFVLYAFMGFCHKYNTPCVTFSATGLSLLTSNQVGNPISPSYVPNIALPYLSHMNFFQRLFNSLMYVFCELVTHLYALPQHNKILQEYFPGAPHITELYYNVSLTLINSHVSTHHPVPLVPNMIDVGGLHIKPPKKLPKDLQEYLDNAKEGVIFFSMGSNVRSMDMPVEKREIFLKTFGQLKQKVLWKWEDEKLSGKPSNVKISKWLPQTDVLAHPNIKLFITHGGLLSTTEAVYHGVPIVGIPLYGDQVMNLANAENNGIGRGLPYSELTEDKLSDLIQEVLTNPKYADNAKRRSSIMRDQPMTALERGVFWVEYALRHKGAPHLRSAALNLAWYQYLLLDVIVFVIAALFMTFLTLRFVIRKCMGSKKKSSKVSEDKKRN
ncbi:hypothetical protein ILUMI_10246 [Ignelater luminosus]|uniref:UDP-glucuronosyltransferase n=1 Tax=Ignelater luminosus TaxID=2038154 RepID=A0A8K0GBN1_IGNLU|nr:hypothetical protein ILUMI_10246 [Ignelater luminosus]